MFQRSNLISAVSGVVWLWTGLSSAAADPAPAAGNDRPLPPLVPVPAPMDEQAIRTLMAQPHDINGMLPELGKLASPGTYRREVHFEHDGNKTDTRDLFVTISVVNRRFLVQQPHPEEEDDSLGALSVWTYDREQQVYRVWLGTADGRILEAQATVLPDSHIFELEFVESPAREDEAIEGTCEVLVDEDNTEMFVLEGESRRGQSRTAWKVVLTRLGEIDQALPEKNWIERNTLLFVLLVNGGWILLVVGACLIGWIVSRRRAEQRTSSLQEPAGELDLPFHADGDDSLADRLSGFPVMNIGRKKKLFNLIIAATPELTLFLFDYSYITGHGKNKRVRRQSVAAVESADLSLPEFHLRPERRLDAIGSLLGRQDIDFDDHPEFSSAFVLKSDVEQQTRDFFDQELLDFFSGQPDTSFEAAQGRFLFFRRWKQVKPHTREIRVFLGEAHALLRALQDRITRNS